MKRLDMLKTTTNLKNTFYEDKKMQDIMIEFYQIKRNHSFITWCNKTDFVNFLEEYNRYGSEIFSVNSIFDELLNDTSHFVVVENFIISTCLSKVLTIDFLQDNN